MSRTLRDKRINQIVYICVGGALAVVVIFLVLFNVFSAKRSNMNNIQIAEQDNKNSVVEEANSNIGKSVDEVKDAEEVKDADNVEVEDDTNKQKVKLDEEKSVDTGSVNSVEPSVNVVSSVENESDSENVENVKEEVQSDPSFGMPVEGEIVKHFGRDKLIYSETLKEWTTHLGIDIKADKTSVVKASSEGKVKSIKNDPRYGLTVVIEHQNGFSSVYANLLSAEFVVIGEEVKAGQSIGTVGNSASFEILDEPHLHFEIVKDGVGVDPEMYIK